ncbi:hypothetical protein C5Y97_12505 [Blastopirellula marina]|uniref:Uncharacterized protein n=1 Tax=Blastopirellula marina TaxID=124 RepID=A0A2S8FWR5_9BACT|nr:hypothetical protein C5Y98_12495 [Blastopirellula marina]PTL44349.1 hypothetical protein C5Y97_12505 [Blastopirellula marina]
MFEEWDPIGVNCLERCRDEYDNYAPGIVRLLQDGADQRRLVQHLRHLEKEAMGLNRDREDELQEVARQLLELKIYL